MAYIIILPDPDWRHRCRHRGGDPDCACYPECPECGALYTPSEGHDCIDSELSKCDLLDIARELRDALDACETERDRLRAQIAALQSVPQGVEVEVPRWEDVDAKFQAGEPRNPLDDFVHSNEPAIDDEDGMCESCGNDESLHDLDVMTMNLLPMIPRIEESRTSAQDHNGEGAKYKGPSGTTDGGGCMADAFC